jgi:hypothetical protein
MKVICTSQQENVRRVCQSTRHHSWQRKFTAPCGWKNSCRQSFVGKTGAKEAIYSYGHRNPQGLAKHPTRSYLGSRARTERRRRNQHHKKGANYGWPVVTYGIDYDGTTISDKTQKPGIEDPSTIGFLLSLLRNDLCNKWYLPQLKGHLVGSLKSNILN